MPLERMAGFRPTRPILGAPRMAAKGQQYALEKPALDGSIAPFPAIHESDVGRGQ